MDDVKSKLEVEASLRPALASNGRGRGRGRAGWGRMVMSSSRSQKSDSEVSLQRSEAVTPTVTSVTSEPQRVQDSPVASNGARCNGRLQRTKRIEDAGEAGEDRASIASVTIISVPSSIVTPVPSSGTLSSSRSLTSYSH